MLDEAGDTVSIAVGHQSANRLFGFGRQRHLHRPCHTQGHTVGAYLVAAEEARGAPEGHRDERAHDGHSGPFRLPVDSRRSRRFARSNRHRELLRGPIVGFKSPLGHPG
jgi:hypothetical protein